MKTIEEFIETRSLIPTKESNGIFSEWLPYMQLEICGDILQFVETRVLGLRGNENVECIEIHVNPGEFNVECKGVRLGDDVRIAGLRVYPQYQRMTRGAKIGEIPVDIGGISIVDIVTIESSLREDEERYEDWLEEILYGENLSLLSVHFWEPTQTKIPRVEGGFGDGLYGVYELKNDIGEIVGLEIEFVPDEY